MEPKTKFDQFIVEQVTPLLAPEEEIEACAYLVEERPIGFRAAAKAKAWLLAITTHRLIRIQTKAGAFKPLRENLGVEIDALSEIRAAHVGKTVVIKFEDGREKHFYRTNGNGLVSTQQAFLAKLTADYGQSDAAQALTAEQGAFDSTLREMTPRLVVTPLLMAINVAVFIAMVSKGVSVTSPSIEHLLSWGADFGPLTTGGEYWRLLTCTFVHVGLLHLALNMWVLWDLGRLVERMLGHIGFACLYFVSGLLASIASIWFKPLAVSAGASGAVFGVAGALIGIVLIDRNIIPPKRLAQLRGSVGMFVVYNLVYGFTQPNIDQAAHIGGLLAGLLCGLVLARSASKNGHANRLRRSLVVAILGAIAIPTLALALPSDVADGQRVLDEFVAVEHRCVNLINEAVKRKASDPEFATVLEKQVLPDWVASRKRLDALENLPEAMQARVALLKEYALLREEGWQLVILAVRGNDAKLVEEAAAKQIKADALIAQLAALNKR